MNPKSLVIRTFLITSLLGVAAAQQPPSSAQPAAPQASAPASPKPVISTTARLNAAKTVFVRKVSGNDIPYNVISNAFDGWAKYIAVDSPEKADLIVEVTAPEEHDTGFAVSSNTSNYESNGRASTPSVTTTKSFTVTNVKMSVIDAHTKTVLWGGNEQPKLAARHNKSEDNLVEAAQKLFQKFHDRVEPPQ